MKLPWRCLLLLSVAVRAAAQVPSGGLATEWDILKTLSSLSEQTRRLRPALEELRPADWVAQGAPATYTAQSKSALAELGYLAGTVAELSRKPDRLTMTLEAFLRLQALETQLDSLSQGVRRYQNPALADLLQGMISENSASREKLRQYLVDLAAAKEEEFRIADQEAQRCRASLIQQPRAPAKPFGKQQ